MTTVNWNDLLRDAEQAGGGAPVPPGEYEVVVHEAESKPTANGKPCVKVKFRVLVGPHAGRIIFNNFVVSAENPNALSFFFQHMAVFGLDRNFFAQNPPMELVAQTLVGRQAKIAGEHRDWQGKPQFDVKKIAPATPGVVAPQVQQAGAPPVPQAAPQPAPAPTFPQPAAPAAPPQYPQPASPLQQPVVTDAVPYNLPQPAPAYPAMTPESAPYAPPPVAPPAYPQPAPAPAYDPAQQQFPQPEQPPAPAVAPPPPPGFPPVAGTFPVTPDVQVPPPPAAPNPGF